MKKNNTLLCNNIYINNIIMVCTMLYKKGIIYNKEPNISDIYYSYEYNKYFYIIKSVFDININIYIQIEDINSKIIEKINKKFIIYDDDILENITLKDTIYLNDMVESIYNYDGKRIYLSKNKFNMINDNIIDNIFINKNINSTSNNTSNNNIMPYGILH